MKGTNKCGEKHKLVGDLIITGVGEKSHICAPGGIKITDQHM